VKLLRDGLADDASAPRYVELVRGQGYRLMLDAEPVPIARQGQAVWPFRWGLAVIATGILGLAGLGLWLLQPASAPSVAVMPFVDMSPDGDQGHLADGIAEELINSLASLEGLHVASRTASFSVDNSEQNLAAIGEYLGVSTVLEGSVRKSGGDIRITVQLVEADTGYQLWSETFDQALVDIFAIQEQIAIATAGALGVRLGVGSSNAFRGAGTTNFTAYEAYLRQDYERAIEIDPKYAAAWARQGIRMASSMWTNLPEDAPGIIEQAHRYTARALELDPESASANGRFGVLACADGGWQQGEESIQKALELRRNRLNLTSYANMMLRTGRVRMAQVMYREAGSVERSPRPPNRLRNSANIAAGDFEAARAMAVQFSDNRRFDTQLHIALNDGTLDDVREALAAMPENVAGTKLYRPVLAELDAPERAIAVLEVVLASQEWTWPSKYHDIAVLAAYLNAPELALEAFSREMRYTTIRFATLWYPVMSDARRLPRFKGLVEQAKLVDYWRRYRWADSCEPLGPDDFECF
jgi:TolB-like protein/tetratricopeptide (TPR) repeat protein